MLECVVRFNASTSRLNGYSGEYSKWMAFYQNECKGPLCSNYPDRISPSFKVKSLLTGNVYSARAPARSEVYFYIETTVQYSKEEGSRDAEWCILDDTKGTSIPS